jgi:hypothetical protein
MVILRRDGLMSVNLKELSEMATTEIDFSQTYVRLA